MRESRTPRHHDIKIGQVFGKWTVIDEVPINERGRVRVMKCRCECGKVANIDLGPLVRGESLSCGCSRMEYRGVPRGKAMFNRVYYGYKRHAKERGFVFELSEEDAKEIMLNNCFYCGDEPSNISDCQQNSGAFIYNGIDRINNKDGYFKDNCVPCCKDCNWMKKDMSLFDFLDKIDKIHKEHLHPVRLAFRNLINSILNPEPNEKSSIKEY